MKVEGFDRRAHPAGAAFSTWEAPDGWPIRRMDWPQPEGRKARGSILFANGRGDFIEKYLEAFGHWHERGWNLASFDWRGQGASSGAIIGGNVDSFDPLVADMDALVRDWRAGHAGPHILIGHSMGGHLLLRYLAKHRPDVTVAVLIAPMLGVNSGKLSPGIGGLIARVLSTIGLKSRRLWKQRPGSGRFRQGFLTHCEERYEDELWWKAQQPGFDLGPPSWGWLNAAYRSTGAVTPDMLRKVSTPILILGTYRDRLVSPAAIRRAASFLPNAETHMYPEAAHEILRESDPVRLDAFSRIDNFLDRFASA
ncbi:MAG TPA: alpha/beta hydrolase [Allosphingosinicella sp.]|uniref:alpha/beta hydrolase n=1 Tax=Allosphingosinicella sp. TaxID=2823234 RepID=UPI002EDA2F0E